jgi:hypothetical protein
MQLIRTAVWALLVFASSAAAASPASAINGGDPAGDYARADNCSTGVPRAPVGVVFEGFPSKQAVGTALDNQTTWDSFGPHVPAQMLKINSSSGVNCVGEDSYRVSGTSGGRRTAMRLWSSSVVTAGTPTLQHQATQGSCVGSWVAIVGDGGGFTAGRDQFEQEFQGANPTYGQYPLKEYNWANTNQIQQCDGSQVGSDGNVTVVQQKDSFGYNDLWGGSTFQPDPDPTKDPLQLAEAQGASVARFQVDWGDVGTAGSNPTQSCAGMGGTWGGDDAAYTYLTGRMVCDSSAPTTGIRPILAVSGAPSPYARWCTVANSQTEQQNCGSGDCTATSDQTPGVPTTPVLAKSTAADADWQGFLENVALRYPLAKGIEIWNEPNLIRKYWGTCLPGPTRYEELLELGHDGVAASGTGTPVVTAGMSTKGEGNPDNTDWLNYLTAVFAAPQQGDPAVRTLFTSMGLHPYRSDDDASQSTGFATAAEDDVGSAHDLLVGKSAGDKPIWVTEVGATTAGTGGTQVTDEAAQATALGSIYQRLRNIVPVVVIHRLVDRPPGAVEPPGYGAVTNPDPPQGDSPWRRKPYYFSLCERRGFTASPC